MTKQENIRRIEAIAEAQELCDIAAALLERAKELEQKLTLMGKK